MGRYLGLLGLKPTGEKAGIGLRRENFGIPESKKLKPCFCGFGLDFCDFESKLIQIVCRPLAGNFLQPVSGPCSIEKYPSSRMANRHTRIFDAG